MKIKNDCVIMRQPDDWHAHLRFGDLMKSVIGLFSVYGRVVCMGNLIDPIDNLPKATAYSHIISSHQIDFLPIIGVMLTKNSTAEEWKEIINKFYGRVMIKFMSKRISTNSELGIEWWELEKFYPIFELAQARQIPILLHAEADQERLTGELIPEIDQEEAAIPYVAKLARNFPEAIINVEHVSTRSMIDVIRGHRNLSGTISPNHLIYIYRDIFDGLGKLKNVHRYFKPVAKRRSDREAVQVTALMGDRKFFFGSDSAPHYRTDKVQFQRAGAFNALTNLAFLCEFFEDNEALDDRFEDFMSNNGAARYGYPLNAKTITLKRQNWTVPQEYRGLVPDLAGRTMKWQIVQ